MKISTTWSSSRMATRVSWSPEEMIISLFMDETPLVCGSGLAPRMRARVQAAGGEPHARRAWGGRVEAAGGEPDALRHHRGDDRHEPDQHAGNVHGPLSRKRHHRQ